MLIAPGFDGQSRLVAVARLPDPIVDISEAVPVVHGGVEDHVNQNVASNSELPRIERTVYIGPTNLPDIPAVISLTHSVVARRGSLGQKLMNTDSPSAMRRRFGTTVRRYYQFPPQQREPPSKHNLCDHALP